jgi:hypothetical protein
VEPIIQLMTQLKETPVGTLAVIGLISMCFLMQLKTIPAIDEVIIKNTEVQTRLVDTLNQNIILQSQNQALLRDIDWRLKRKGI